MAKNIFSNILTAASHKDIALKGQPQVVGGPKRAFLYFLLVVALVFAALAFHSGPERTIFPVQGKPSEASARADRDNTNSVHMG